MPIQILQICVALCLAVAGFTSAALANADAVQLSAASANVLPSANPVHVQVFDSKPFVIDRIYRTMMGPKTASVITIGDRDVEERIWILSYETEIVDTSTGQQISDEYMCHNNILVPDFSKQQKMVGMATATAQKRLFTLSQGVMKIEFPQGFGIPFQSGEPILLNSQVLNLNPLEKPLEVLYRSTVRYVKESELVQEVRSLRQFGVMGLKLLSGDHGYPGVADPDPAAHGESCAVGEVVAGGVTMNHDDGRVFTNHWVVEPGREENHTLITSELGLSQDATLHYIGVHLHPYGESLELKDLTTNETIFKSHARNRKGRAGLEHVDAYSSIEGTRLFKDHEYTLISVYENDSGEMQDAMAIMFLYLGDSTVQ
jgi:hypothetical protein